MQKFRNWTYEFADAKVMLGIFLFLVAATFWLIEIGVIK